MSVRGCGMLSGSVGVVRGCECEGVWDVEWISGCGESVCVRGCGMLSGSVGVVRECEVGGCEMLSGSVGVVRECECQLQCIYDSQERLTCIPDIMVSFSMSQFTMVVTIVKLETSYTFPES